MKPASFCLAALLALPCAARGQDTSTPSLPPKPQLHVFILAGQSNMAGRGKLDDEARRTNRRILSLNREGAWQVAVDPLHWDKPAAGVGLGRAFAEAVAQDHPGATIALVPTACGGSPIASWQPGQSWAQTRSNPYDDFLTRSRRALRDGTLKAILWHQGESDATPDKAAGYETRLIELIVRMRRDLETPDAPFIIGQLGRFPGKPWNAEREAIDAAHRAVASKVKNVAFVSAEGFGSIGDELHFDTPSLRTFGQRYAEAYRRLTAKAPR